MRGDVDRWETYLGAWNSPELVALIGGPLDPSGINGESLRLLVDEATSESEQLEFKLESYSRTRGPRGDWTTEQEFAKDVAAFANARGGLLVVGVAEQDGVATSIHPLELPDGQEGEERRLRTALANHQAPLADCQFVWVTLAEGGVVLAVVVPPSRRSPHAVTAPSDGRAALRYPIRNGSDTLWMAEHDVARRYYDRLSSRRDEASRLTTVVTAGLNALGRSSGVWLFASISPELAVDMPLDSQTVRDIESWHWNGTLALPPSRTIGAAGRGSPAPGQVTFTGPAWGRKEDEAEVRDAYISLHVSGAAFAAVPIVERTNDDADGTRSVGEITLVDDCILLVDETCRWSEHQVGTWGTATLVAGLVDAGSRGLTEPVQLVSFDYGRMARLRGTRSVAGEVQTSTVIDLGAVSSMQQRLSICHAVLSGLMQWFGRVEPSQLKPDGTLVPSEFPSNWEEMRDWAKRMGVPTSGPAG